MAITPLRPNQVRVDTGPYVRSHGKQPRGIGAWAFGLSPNPPISEVMFAPGRQSYQQAVRWAQQMAVQKGKDTIYVQP